MIDNRFVRRAALPAMALVAGLTMVGWSLAPGAVANTPNTLQVYIENQTDFTIYRSGKFSIFSSPTSIAPYATGEIKADAADQVYADVTYADNAEASASSCSVQVQIQYSYNTTTQRCEDKKFSYYRLGKCEVEQMGTCSGANTCKYHFTFTRTD